MHKTTDDLRIKTLRPLIAPAVLKEKLAITATAAERVAKTRQDVARIIRGQDDRLLVVVGPCSIHDPAAALDYAERLKVFSLKLSKQLLIIMRVYFEKPRTIIGWKGLINDPHLDGSFAVNEGLQIARQLLLDINNLGLPAGTEFLDTIIPQYISDLISWGAIGARTTESQIHRELASGLSMPIGFKNGTNGNIQIALDAIRAAHHSHHFLGVTKDGVAAIIGTSGNQDCHIILRGATAGPNYDAETVARCASLLEQAGLSPRLMVDCSHGNSNKDFKKQALVAEAVCNQLSDGSRHICGVMLESNLVEGNQPLHASKELLYGQSITDGCLSWQETKPLLNALALAVKQRKQTLRLA